MRDHRIVVRIRVFGDVEIFLDDTPHVGEERPVGTNPAATFIRLSDIVGADRDKSAITNLELPMKLDQPFGLPAVLGAITATAKYQNHWMLPLQFGELPTFRGMVGKLIVGEGSPRNDVGPHVTYSTAGCARPSCIATVSTGVLRRSRHQKC